MLVVAQKIPHFLQDTSVYRRVHKSPPLDHILAKIQPISSHSISIRFSSSLPNTPRIKTFLSSVLYQYKGLAPGNENTSITNTSFSTTFHILDTQISLSEFICEYKLCFSCKIIGYIPLTKVCEYWTRVGTIMYQNCTYKMHFRLNLYI
jgi:hypothetical protein